MQTGDGDRSNSELEERYVTHHHERKLDRYSVRVVSCNQPGYFSLIVGRGLVQCQLFFCVGIPPSLCWLLNGVN